MPISGPPALTRFLPHHQLNRRCCQAGRGARAALAEGHHGELLDLSNAEIRIPFPHNLQRSIRVTQQLRLQPEVGAEAIQGKGRADQLLIRCWNPGNAPVQISQQLTAMIEDADAPHPLFRSYCGFEGRLQRWTKCSAGKESLALTLYHRWRCQQRRRCPEGQLGRQNQQGEQSGTNHRGVTPLTTPLKR